MSDDFKLVIVPTMTRGAVGRPRVDRSPYRIALEKAIAEGAPADIGILLAEAENEPSKGNKTWQSQGLTVASRKRPDGKYDHYVQLWDESKAVKRPRKPKTNGDGTVEHADGTVEVPLPDTNPDDPDTL